MWGPERSPLLKIGPRGTRHWHQSSGVPLRGTAGANALQRIQASVALELLWGHLSLSVSLSLKMN